jgi:hypothetical protein
MWWDHFKTMQQGRAVSWDEFKQAFKSHHILMDRKMRELLALRQGSDTVLDIVVVFGEGGIEL